MNNLSFFHIIWYNKNNNREVVRVNRKGQALVEFVLILPIFILILLVVIDFGNILYSKNKLENNTTDIIRMIKNDENSLFIKKEYPDISIEITDYKEGYKKVILTSEVKINTFFLDKILGNPCQINTERVIPDE